MRRLLRGIRRRLQPARSPRPSSLRALRDALAANFRAVSGEDLDRIRALFRLPQTPEGARAVDEHVVKRVDMYRRNVIPWLDQCVGLDGCRILEIGCGTGASTLTLAEQGALVTGIDIDADSVSIARERCRLYGVEVRLEVRDAASGPIAQLFKDRDLILYNASLEHMTYGERLRSLSMAWSSLAPGQLVGVTDTPNRLWYVDGHTTMLPFFHWLPDELAVRYAGRSRHPNCDIGEALRSDADPVKSLIRVGRGVSFHEFELAFGGLDRFEVVSDIRSFKRSRSRRMREAWSTSKEKAYRDVLHAAMPELHPAFLESGLDLILRKTGDPANDEGFSPH